MGYFYFAGQSLASMTATRELAVKHQLIWRKPGPGLPKLVDGDKILLSFWPELLITKKFIPLAMFKAKKSDGPANQGPCYTTIPENILKEFLGAERGVGGQGYRDVDNPTHMAISVRLIMCQELDEFWKKGHTPPFYGFNRPATGRQAFWRFNVDRLLDRPNRLPESMWPK